MATLAFFAFLFVAHNFDSVELRIAGYAFVAIAALFAALGNERFIKRNPAELENELIGKRCTALESFAKREHWYEGTVRVSGEVWNAKCSELLPKDARAIVERRNGLVLEVRSHV